MHGTIQLCDDCAKGKAQHRGVHKVKVEWSMIPGERLFTNISPPKVTSIGGSKHWLLVIDD